jgi:hypothetical protein
MTVSPRAIGAGAAVGRVVGVREAGLVLAHLIAIPAQSLFKRA